MICFNHKVFAKLGHSHASVPNITEIIEAALKGKKKNGSLKEVKDWTKATSGALARPIL